MLKVAREAGEDEDPNIQLLKEKGIWIGSELKEFLSYRHMCFYILEPFQKLKFEKLKRKLSQPNPRCINGDYPKSFKENEVSYMKYPRFVDYWKIDQNIFDDLKEEHMINSELFTDEEWIEIQSIKPWKRCQKQVAREIIATEICEQLNISS